jgi:hypothetical protein
MLIDVAITGDRNVIKKEAVKVLKYKDFIIEIQGMWNVKAKVIPGIRGVTRTISEHSNNIRATNQKSTKLRNYKKQPNGAMNTYYRKCYCKSTKHIPQVKYYM